MKGKFKITKLFILIVSISLIIVGCSSNENVAKEDGMDVIDISVTHYPTGLYAVPYNVGIEKGFFEEEGIKINKIIGSSGGGTTARNVLSGDLPFGDVSTSAVIQSYLAGAPLQIVSGAVQSLGDVVYVTRNDADDIETVNDMVRKTWSFTNPGSVTETTSQLIFEAAGIDLESVNFVAAGGVSEGLTMLDANEVDAAVILEPTYSVQKDDWKMITRVSDYVPNYQQSVIVTSPQVIKENPDLVKRFLSAYSKSVNWIYENPEEAAKIFAKSAEIDEDASIAAINDLIDARHWDSNISEESMNNVVKGMILAETLKEGQEIEWEDIFDLQFLPNESTLDMSKLDRNN